MGWGRSGRGRRRSFSSEFLQSSRRISALFPDLRGAESAILNRESSDSESCDSSHAIPRSLLALIGCNSDGDSEIDFPRFCSAAIRLIWLRAVEFLAIPPAILGIVRFAIRDSVPLSS